MPLGFIFWTLMILSFVLSMWWHGPTASTSPGPFVNNLLVFILFFLLGWAQFGFVVQR